MVPLDVLFSFYLTVLSVVTVFCWPEPPHELINETGVRYYVRLITKRKEKKKKHKSLNFKGHIISLLYIKTGIVVSIKSESCKLHKIRQ